MSGSVTRSAYAKVNLSLDVGPRGPDGFHPVWSVLQTISLADTLEVELTAIHDVVLTADGFPVPCGPDNIAYRAAVAMRRGWGASTGVRLHLTKRTPMEAGLGGGSSDAAAAVLALAQLLDLDHQTSEIETLAASLGSDVPFFLRGGTAMVQGNRGDRVEPLPEAPDMWLVLVKPAVGVSTGRAYAALDAVPGRLRGRSTGAVADAVRRGSLADLVRASGNDFETILPLVCPSALSAMDDLLAHGALTAHLCGSGSAVFGIAGDADHAEAIARALRPRWPWVCVCRTIGALEAQRG